MIAEFVVRRRVQAFLDAFQAKDFDALARAWSKDVVLELPLGLPMGGAWEGKEELSWLFEAIFAYNRRLTFTLRHVAVAGAWSPTGRGTVLTEWQAREERLDGQVVEFRVVSVAESRRWQVVRTRDYFSDVPAVAAYYDQIELPRRSSTTVS